MKRQFKIPEASVRDLTIWWECPHGKMTIIGRVDAVTLKILKEIITGKGETHEQD